MDTLDGYVQVIPVWVPGQLGTGSRGRAPTLRRENTEAWRTDIDMYLSRDSTL